MIDWMSVIVYFFLFFIIPMNLYLRKSGKTFKEVVEDIVEFFRGWEY